MSWAVALMLVVGACGTSDGTSDAGASDTGAADTGAADANTGVPSPDAGPDTVSVVDTGPDFPALTEDAATDTSAVDAPAAVDTPPASDAIRPDLGRVTSRKLDLLFMIDNSPSMQEEQANLRRNFAVFMEELKKVPGGLPDLHVGVITSDLGAGSIPLANGGCPRPGGDRGILQTKPSCGLDPSARFISSANNQTQNNFQGPIDAVFSCIANLGVAGCGYEHQLQATRVALYESVTKENAGFLRDDALLAIVLVTDEDDCSAETTSNLFTDDASFPMTAASFRCSQVGHLCNGLSPPITPFDAPLENCQANPAGRLIKVSDIVDSIKALKRNPAEQILVAGIFGWPSNPLGARYRYVQTNQGVDVSPICKSANGEAAVALRLKQFAESFGQLGSFFSICQDDWSPALRTIGQAVATRF